MILILKILFTKKLYSVYAKTCATTEHVLITYTLLELVMLRLIYYRNHRNKEKKRLELKITRPIHNTTMGTQAIHYSSLGENFSNLGES